MTEFNRPLTEEEKQRKSMPDETSPEDAVTKAREFAAQEKAKLRKGKSQG